MLLHPPRGIRVVKAGSFRLTMWQQSHESHAVVGIEKANIFRNKRCRHKGVIEVFIKGIGREERDGGETECGGAVR